jgi:glycosyltransferase involved in cell wall biosynthesis
MANPLASIVIPCYNAERWVGQAVQSCLDQTYRPIEIVVVDDGSTDGSRRLLERYGDAITLLTGPNQGGNAARNRGTAASRGDFIQNLDADDTLLPDKIERQVRFLLETGADVVYGDWRHRFHPPGGESYLGRIVKSASHSDVLEALLGSWWVASGALLFRRTAALAGGGWDETFSAAQDGDFLITVVLQGVDIRYQPGCAMVYRKHGSTTVSSSSQDRWLACSVRMFEKAEKALSASARLIPAYRAALARSYFRIARNYFDRDRSEYARLLGRVQTLDTAFRPQESRAYNLAYRLAGPACAERAASLLRRIRREVAPR